MIVCRTDDSVFLFEHRINLPPFEDVVSGGDDVSAGIKEHPCAFGSDAVSFGRVFSIDDTGVHADHLFQTAQVFGNKITA